MEWYQPFECDNTVANPLVCDSDNLEEYGFEDWDFVAGRKITNLNRIYLLGQAKKRITVIPMMFYKAIWEFLFSPIDLKTN